MISLLAPPARSAHFDIDSGRVVLRQLQYCTHCGSALLVTNIHPGVLVRCPDCGSEQQRIENQYILNQMYQLCKTCQGPLNPEGHKPGDMTSCENCRTRQPLNRDAFALAKKTNGPGYAPGYPPGKAEKTLLLAPSHPDAFLAMIPLDHSESDLPLPPNFINKTVPKPPDHFAAKHTREPEPEPLRITEETLAKTAQQPVRERDTLVITEQIRKKTPDRETARAPRPKPEFPLPVRRQPQARRPDPQPASPPTAPADAPGARESDAQAFDVPAVTADLFGGKRLAPAAQNNESIAPPGRVVARVNGEPIYGRDIDRVVDPVMERLRSRATKEETALLDARENDLRQEVLERLIDRELVVREAAAMGYAPDPAAIRNRENELAQIFTTPGVNLRREAMRDITMADMRKQFDRPGSAAPGAVRELYQAHKQQLVQPRRIALDQLVVYEDRTARADKRNYRRIAIEIAEAFEHGKKFDDLRERYDEFAPAAGVEHAEPELLPEAAYSRQVLQAAGELRKGAVFGPLLLPGMALFGKVADERKEGPVPFEEVEKEIRVRLEAEATERMFGDWLRKLREKARIESFLGE